MRLADLRRPLARSDVRTGAIVGSVLVTSVSAIAVFAYAHTSMELLEEADRWFDYSCQVAMQEFEERGAAPEAIDAVLERLPRAQGALRIRDPSGRILAERGAWPVEERRVRARTHEPQEDHRNLLSMRLLRTRNWLVGERHSASGVSLEVALPLRHFAREAQEQLRLMTTGGLVAAGIVLLIGLGAVGLAFAPLRRGTLLLRDADGGTRGLRLPSRGTGDPIDRHAETLNRVLERIDAAFLRLRSFSSNVAHELRTPLNRISTVSEVALLRGGESGLRAALEAVQSTTEQLSRVVHSLLLLAEIDDRRLTLQRDPIDLEPWIAHHVDAFGPSFEGGSVKLVADVEPLEIRGDRTLLDRILANLLDNALTHAPAGSSVEIRARRAAGGVSICVDDAGRGIPERDRERIFDRFERVAGHADSGHGLGLALARAIAELHGGSLRVSESPAGGARFELWLPSDRLRS